MTTEIIKHSSHQYIVDVDHKYEYIFDTYEAMRHFGAKMEDLGHDVLMYETF